MNGGGERSAELSCETILGKGNTGKYCRKREHSIDILIEKKNYSKFSIYNLHGIPTLKKSFNIIS